MSKEVSPGQVLEIASRIVSQVGWKQVDGEKLQKEVISLSPEEFGRRFTEFIKAGARFIFGGLKVACVQFDPAKFIDKDWAFWKGPKDGNGLEGEEERDKGSLALTEVDFAAANLLTCLEKGESSITGEEKLIRLRNLGRPLYGATQFMGLWQDYQSCQNKSDSKLEKLYQQKGIAYVDFFGDILRIPGGFRYVLCLCRRGDGSWYWSCSSLGLAWSDYYFAAVAQQVSS
ncbi:MAG: Uncharacterized protein CEN87_362 [Parcubacteria group bacterium Licking1014_1]|nr:MAG: Uncharacterized protein CEN87_362 [Parcubacteria group bacterium Licking1014_1]